MIGKNLFFDLDGTLTDPGLGITNSVMHALARYGIQNVSRESLYPFIGPPLVDSFQKYYGFSKEKAFEATRFFQEYFSTRGMYENQLYEGVVPMLEELKEKGKRLVLATSKPEEFAVTILKHFSLFSYFDFVCGGSMNEKTRTRKTEVVSYALETSAADPRESVMIGDRMFDVEGGKENGLRTLGVLYGYGSREELEAAGADRLAQTVRECKEILLLWEK